MDYGIPTADWSAATCEKTKESGVKLHFLLRHPLSFDSFCIVLVFSPVFGYWEDYLGVCNLICSYLDILYWYFNVCRCVFYSFGLCLRAKILLRYYYLDRYYFMLNKCWYLIHSSISTELFCVYLGLRDALMLCQGHKMRGWKEECIVQKRRLLAFCNPSIPERKNP